VRLFRRENTAALPLTAWPTVHQAWVNAIDELDGLGSDRDRVADRAADLVETLFTRPIGAKGALERFGSRLASEGWSLEQVSRWVDVLVDSCDSSQAAYLRTFEAGVAMSHGWTEGHLYGLRAADCLDPVTGLCTTSVLKIRMQQAFEQCAALGVEANWMYRLVIVDADINDCNGLEADAIMVVLADVVQKAFRAGETIAREGGRVFVLANMSETLYDDARTLLDSSRKLALLNTSRVLTWVEDLPADPLMVDRFFADFSV
jgi:GGDEF domain-containing protein